MALNNREFPVTFKIVMLLIFYVLAGPGLIDFDVYDLNFPREVSAGSHQTNSDKHLEQYDHIILTWAGNPATTQAVTWRCLVDDKSAIAELAPAKASPDFVKSAR